MLTALQLAVVRAPLRFWQEEMCPHGQNAVQPYADCNEVIAMSAAEVAALRARFLPGRVRYGIYDFETKRLAAIALVRNLETTEKQLAGNQAVVTVLVPALP
jgi:hypothetical protein